MPTADHVRDRIAAAFPRATAIEVVDTTGTGDHFQATVEAPDFLGLSRIDQHRLVYDAVRADLADGSIHALSIRTCVADS